jgi:hypothetical protein
VTKKKIRLLIPLIIIGGLISYTWLTLLVEGYTAIWRHYIALGLFGFLIFLFVRDFTKAVVATGLYLLLGTFNLLSLTASTVWNSYGVKVGSAEIWTPSFQFLSFCLVILYAILNFDTLTEIYFNYKEAKQRKTKETIEVDNEGITIVGDQFRSRIKWTEVTELNVFKKDFATFDRVELNIVFGDKSVTVNEDVKGWTEFVDKTKQIFPSMPKNWEAEVVHQPYVTNFTTIYQRV